MFPKIKNIRSVINIKNLSEFIRLLIVNKLRGVFFPQDNKYFDTTEFIIKNRAIQGKKTILLPFLFLPLKLIGFFIKSVNKIYGNKFYDQSVSLVKNINYQIYSIDDLIKELKDIL